MKSIFQFWPTLFVVLSSLFVLKDNCRAGGSLGWDEARIQILRDDPFLADYIAKNFDVNHVGGGVRVGHDKDGNSIVPGLEIGQRIPPYEFLAKPRGAAGDYTLRITLEPQYFDNGKTYLWTLTLRKRLPSE